MSRKNFITINLLIIMLLPCWQNTAFAEIYKYKDKNGKWQFTDKPPKGKKNAPSVSYSSNTSGNISDYQKSLTEKYNPDSPVETATLAVITIKSIMGSGSGFFISDDCYLVTNKHVVRPTETKKWEQSKKEIDDDKGTIKKAKQAIKEEKERLKLSSRKLDDYRDYIDGLRPGGEKNHGQKEYQYRLRNYKRDLKALDEKKTQTKQLEKEFREERSNFSMNSSIAAVTNSFEVTLKDNTETHAQLIHIDKEEDLALLKIDRCKAPFLTLNASIQAHQGVTIP